MKISKNCAYCGKEIFKYPSEIRTNDVYCSKSHKQKAVVSRKVSMDCAYCGKIVWRFPSQVIMKETFCCPGHIRKGKNGNLNGMWNPNAKRHQGKYLHRRIAEKVLDRPLKRNEVVHHIDENKNNNRNDNLAICSVSYHGWIHHRMNPETCRKGLGQRWQAKKIEGLAENVEKDF